MAVTKAEIAAALGVNERTLDMMAAVGGAFAAVPNLDAGAVGAAVGSIILETQIVETKAKIAAERDAQNAARLESEGRIAAHQSLVNAIEERKKLFVTGDNGAV